MVTGEVRSIGNVIDELRFIEQDLPQVRSVMLQDDTFTEERAAAFANAKIDAGIRLPWSCYARASLSFEALALMKQSGCRNIHVGYESANNETLGRIKKGITSERMERFTVDAKRAGLRIHGDFVLGFPGETREQAAATIDWAYRLDPHTAQFQILIPFPGTQCHREMKGEGWLDGKGQPDMPQFSNRDIRAMARKAYRKFYFSPRYLMRALAHPQEYIFDKARTICSAVPSLFWKRWDLR